MPVLTLGRLHTLHERSPRGIQQVCAIASPCRDDHVQGWTKYLPQLSMVIESASERPCRRRSPLQFSPREPECLLGSPASSDRVRKIVSELKGDPKIRRLFFAVLAEVNNALMCQRVGNDCGHTKERRGAK